jgi:hypothetical protein
MLHCRDGAWFPPDVTLGIQAKEFNLGFIRPNNLSGAIWQTPSGLSCAFYWGMATGAIKAWFVECCRDGRTFQKDNHLHRRSLELCQSDHRVLGHLPDQGPSLPITQFGRVASSRVLVVPNFLHLRMMETTVFLGTVNAADLCHDTILSLSSTDNSFYLMSWFLFWHALSTVRPYIDRCVPFQIMSNQLNLPQVDSKLKKHLKDDQWKQDAPEINFSKGSEYLCKSVFFLYICENV